MLERECVIAKPALICKGLQWKRRPDSIRVTRLSSKLPCCVASAWNSGSARNDEVKHEKTKMADECLNADASKSSSEGAISGTAFAFHLKLARMLSVAPFTRIS